MTTTTRQKVMMSPRQYEVYQLMLGGLTNAEIGDQLAISENTVKNHISAISRRIGLSNGIGSVSRSRIFALQGELEVEVIKKRGWGAQRYDQETRSIIRADYTGVVNLMEEPAEAGIERCVRAFREALTERVERRMAAAS